MEGELGLGPQADPVSGCRWGSEETHPRWPSAPPPWVQSAVHWPCLEPRVEYRPLRALSEARKRPSPTPTRTGETGRPEALETSTLAPGRPPGGRVGFLPSAAVAAGMATASPPAPAHRASMPDRLPHPHPGGEQTHVAQSPTWGNQGSESLDSGLMLARLGSRGRGPSPSPPPGLPQGTVARAPRPGPNVGPARTASLTQG